MNEPHIYPVYIIGLPWWRVSNFFLIFEEEGKIIYSIPKRIYFEIKSITELSNTAEKLQKETQTF